MFVLMGREENKISKEIRGESRIVFHYLRTVPTFVTAHLEILRFPMGGAY